MLNIPLHKTIYITKGSVIGVYFKEANPAFPVIGISENGRAGSLRSNNFIVCLSNGTEESLLISCHRNIALVLQNTLVMYVKATLSKLQKHYTNFFFPRVLTLSLSQSLSSDSVTVNCGQPKYDFDVRCILLNGTTMVGDTAKCTCTNTAGLSNEKYIACQGNGEWSAFSCSSFTAGCSDPGEPKNGWRNGDKLSPESIVTYHCYFGYKLIGSSVSYCLPSHQWNSSVPTCQLISCGPPSPIVNGYSIGNGYNYGSEVQFICYPGYMIKKQSNVTVCNEDGEWSGSTPTCHIMYCKHPVVPQNGILSYTNFSVNSTVYYTCQTGYTLRGVDSITCQANGEWSNKTTPTCIPSPPFICNGTTATYCNESYTLSSDIITCTGHLHSSQITISKL